MPVLSPETKASNYKVAQGIHTTVAAVDTIATGLKECLGITATLHDDPNDDLVLVTAQASTGGNAIIKTWKNTTGTDPTPLAATVFAKKVNWIAFGY